MKPGHWLVRVVQNGPWVAARLWLCNHEPGEPDNIIDRPPYWRGQIGLDEVPPEEVWEMVAFIEATAAEREAIVNPPLSEREPRGNREPALQWAPLAKWKQNRARRITKAEFDRRVAIYDDCLDYRKPISAADLPLPIFKEL